MQGSNQPGKPARTIHIFPRWEPQNSRKAYREKIEPGETGLRGEAERTPGSFLFALSSEQKRKRRRKQIFSIAAAAFIVFVLIGGTLVWFGQIQSQTQTPTLPGAISKPLGPVGKPVTVTTKVAGLEMSMRVTSGPYFLGELLAVDLSLTNLTHPILTMQGSVGSFPCEEAALHPDQTDGASPHYALYTLPIPFVYNCPMMGPGIGSTLAPGQTVAAHFYELLTGNGNITLTGEASFYLTKTSSQGSPGPLAGHLPMLSIHVMPQIPSDRMLSLHQEASHVAIQAPAGLQLMSQTYILCQDSSNHPFPGGYEVWEPLSTHTLSRPTCSEVGNWNVILWKYAIGAVGYAVVQGQSTN